MKNFKDIAYHRSKVYGTLSHFYIYIPDKKINSLNWEHSLHLLENPMHNNEAVLIEIGEGAKILLSFTFKKFTEETLLNILKEWTRLLRGVDIKGPLPPYESVYLTGRLQNKPSQEIYRLFSEMGINIPDEWHQTPDYIGVQLDFMRLLCEKEIEGWNKNSPDSVKETLIVENSFIRDHLGAWVSEFCETMQKEAREEYFKGIAKLTKGIVEYDKVLIPYILEKFIT